MRTAIILSALAVLAATSPIGAPKRLVVRDPPLSDGVSILDTINKYRDLYGLNEFTWNDDVSHPMDTQQVTLSLTQAIFLTFHLRRYI